MKVGIISINKYSKHLNYGAALHSYAFQHYLDMHGIDNVIIDYLPRFMKSYNMKYPVIARQPKEQFRRSLFWLGNFFPNIVKYNKFMNFFQQHYRSTRRYTEKQLKKAKLDFDTIVCESDVIWSPHSTQGFDNGFFCNLPSMQDKNKISYAACIGYTKFSEKRQEKFRELLKNFDAISVREVQGTEFTQQFTDKKVYNVLDPTLLLDAKDYQDIITPPKEQGYVLVYNCLKNNKKMVRDAKKVARDLGLKVIEVSVYYGNFYLDKVKISAGIEEFLGYFQNASYVFTNAFHGVCFSLIFKKDFYTYARGTKDSRVTSLLHLMDLDDKFLQNDQELPPITSIDYDKVYEHLARERKTSQDFLFQALHRKEAQKE
ncbi:MAG: polysaccharide pyruvyl transferase family protein [Lachnospiraceae bacterium]|nr:polysaccharide pyruvyl transferase family protein [Lachnospiraceae bacterium]